MISRTARLIFNFNCTQFRLSHSIFKIIMLNTDWKTNWITIKIRKICQSIDKKKIILKSNSFLTFQILFNDQVDIRFWFFNHFKSQDSSTLLLFSSIMGMSDEKPATQTEKTVVKKKLYNDCQRFTVFFKSMAEWNAIRSDKSHNRFQIWWNKSTLFMFIELSNHKKRFTISIMLGNSEWIWFDMTNTICKWIALRWKR